jgi:hypothetical protein
MVSNGTHNSDSNSNSGEDDDNESVDRRFLAAASSNKGWQGSSMELTHQMESHRDQKASQYAAVDIRQFQNTQVGKGYQAKHVVRQRQVADQQDTEPQVVKDMTLVKTSATAATTTTRSNTGGSRSKSKRKRKSNEKKRRADPDPDTTTTATSTATRGGPKSKLPKYLSSPGLLLFRGELEDILNS